LDVSVLPSGSESLSNVILESMAAAVPVVASNVGGNPELIESGKCGLLFASGDEAAFVAELTRLFKNAELRKMLGHNAREKAQARYSIGAVKQQYQRLYRQVLAEKRRETPASIGVDHTSSAKERPTR
jgi:glycosyltransferase involved in cell wall biosynthesis